LARELRFELCLAGAGRFVVFVPLDFTRRLCVLLARLLPALRFAPALRRVRAISSLLSCVSNVMIADVFLTL